MTVRVRYAGSPSGDLHLGNIRTAIFNWLFARHEGGTFIHRVEDTDPERAKPELIARVYETLDWLGLDRDEGPDVGGPHEPYRQSERAQMHRDAAAKLEASGAVYRCYCTRDDIKERGVKTGYDRFCRERPDQPDAPYALRFRVPDEDTVVTDVLRGDVRTAFEEMQDFVVQRSDGSPTFVLANTVDDIAMEITHVMRATDLLPAAAQNTLLFRALGAEPPVFAHVPLILGPDKARLGARHGAVGTLSYRDAGYLPEALLNYLALLGWSPGDDREVLSRDELVELFTLDGIVSSPAVFDIQKLDWMNQQYMQKLGNDELIQRTLALHPDLPRDVLQKVVEMELIQSRAVRLSDIPDAIRYLYERPTIDHDSRWLEDADALLEAVATRLGTLDAWDAEAIKECVQGVITEVGAHRKRGPKALFVAITGSDRALPLFESIFLIGRDESVERLRRAITSPPIVG